MTATRPDRHADHEWHMQNSQPAMAPAGWLKASTCRRPARRSLLGRLLASLASHKEVSHG